MARAARPTEAERDLLFNCDLLHCDSLHQEIVTEAFSTPSSEREGLLLENGDDGGYDSDTESCYEWTAGEQAATSAPCLLGQMAIGTGLGTMFAVASALMLGHGKPQTGGDGGTIQDTGLWKAALPGVIFGSCSGIFAANMSGEEGGEIYERPAFLLAVRMMVLQALVGLMAGYIIGGLGLGIGALSMSLSVCTSAVGVTMFAVRTHFKMVAMMRKQLARSSSASAATSTKDKRSSMSNKKRPKKTKGTEVKGWRSSSATEEEEDKDRDRDLRRKAGKGGHSSEHDEEALLVDSHNSNNSGRRLSGSSGRNTKKDDKFTV